VAVVSGQQVGLFGGPAYAFYKAIAAVRIARDLTEQGIDAVPVFWMATEDHDLDEVRRVSFFGDCKLVKFELPANVGNLAPVGRIPLGSGIEALQSEAIALLGAQDPGSVAQILSECYTPDETYGSAFGKLFARLLAASGLILLDPLDLRLHQIAEPIFAKAIEQRDSLEEQLLDRGKALENADYGAQVKVSSRSTVLFHISRDGRQAIISEAGKFESGGKSWSKAELLAAIHDEPENFSPNALLRPVVQDFLLPTVAYIGGPWKFPTCAVRSFVPQSARSHASDVAACWLHFGGHQSPTTAEAIWNRSRGRLERLTGVAQPAQQGQRPGKHCQLA
jgi:bacillithiol biosynthesis cysteine-adding enzyme BshC